MLNLPPHIRIYACMSACDMRKQMDGLAGLVQQGMGRNPSSGDMYIFRNKRGDMIKVLFYDQQGYCLLVKRLDQGTFKLATDGVEATIELTGADLAALMAKLPVVKNQADFS